MALDEYQRKRRFSKTPEPSGRGDGSKSDGWRFVVQKHDARRLHYDFRLEMDGVLKSWAVPKGPSLDPADKRLAVATEDHPLEYFDFEGVIPAGEYGGGTVIVWDQGIWTCEGDPVAAHREGKIKLALLGEKLQGVWMLVRLRDRGEGGDNWLLIKERDETARRSSEYNVLDERPDSVLSGRSLKDVAADPDRTWSSRSSRNNARTSATFARSSASKSSSTSRSKAGSGESRQKREPQRVRRSKSRSNGSGRHWEVLQHAKVRTAELPATWDPTLATLSQEPPDGDKWLHEIKLDGYRMLCRLDGGRVQFLSRNGNDWTDKLQRLVPAVQQLGVEQALLDGEVVVLRADGTTSFQDLQNALGDPKSANLTYFLFDLLHLDGHDISRVPLEQRKTALAELLGNDRDEGLLRYSDHIVGDGPQVYQQAAQMGVEGIISKRRDRAYRSGRTTEWLKIKCLQVDEFVVGGFTRPSGARKGFGALLVGFYENDSLVYAGRVGTGFNEATLRSLHAELKQLQIDDTPFDKLPRKEGGKGVYWVHPQLVAHIEYNSWTRDGVLRHPSFRGLREDITADQVARPQDSEPPPDEDLPAVHPDRLEALAEQLAEMRFTNPQRILYPVEGITKLELAQYYAEVADHLLPHIAARPLSLVRCPKGSEEKCFYQKHAPQGLPEAVRRIDVPEKGVEKYLAIDDAAGLLALVQFSALELHAWGARDDKLEAPDRLVFDLDPDPAVAWRRVVEGAVELRERLEEIGLQSFVKTTGGKGLHVVVPVTRRHDWDLAKEFTRRVAEQIAASAPTRYTTNMSKAARRGKIYLDYLRNGRGATSIAPYSTRARPHAPVAVPVHWKELASLPSADHYNVRSLRRRLASLKSDPWEKIGNVRQSLTRAVLKHVDL